MEDLYIDWQEREVRFLELGTGGFLGIGEKRFLVPVEAVTQVAEDRVTIEPGWTEKVDGPAPFDTKVEPLVQTSRATKICGWSISRPLSTSCREGRPLRIQGALVRAYH